MTETELRNLAEAATPLDHLLITRGLYWRPDKKGYTGLKCEAGRYPKGEAAKYRSDDVNEVYEDKAPDYAPNCAADIRERHMMDELTALRAKVKSQGEVELIAAKALIDKRLAATERHLEKATGAAKDELLSYLMGLGHGKDCVHNILLDVQARNRRAAQEAGHE